MAAGSYYLNFSTNYVEERMFSGCHYLSIGENTGIKSINEAVYGTCNFKIYLGQRALPWDDCSNLSCQLAD